MKIAKTLSIVSVLVGLFIVLNAVGGMELGKISIPQCFLISAVGFILCIPCVLLELHSHKNEL